FVTEEFAGSVTRVTAPGAFTKFATGFNDPFGITVDPSGNVYVAERGTGSIWKFTKSAPLYNICPLYDATKPVQSGATIPIKLQLCNSNNVNLSASNTVLHAISISMFSSNISGDVQDSG